MKNLKVGKKFIVSFGMILTVFLVSVIVATVGIVRARASYEKFYMNDYKAVTGVYEIQLKLQEGLKELLLAVVETDSAQTAKRVATVNQYMDAVTSELQSVYANYSGDVSRLKDFENGMQNNKGTRLQIIELAGQNTDEADAEAQRLVLEEYNPQVEGYVEDLQAAFAQMGRESQESFDAAMAMQTMLIAVAVGVAAVAFIMTVIIALTLTGNIIVPVKKIQSAMADVVQGQLSVNIDYESADEFGEMAEDMNKMTGGISRIIKDIEIILTAMAEIGRAHV